MVRKIDSFKERPDIRGSKADWKKFRSDILKAFKYSTYRKSVLVELAKRLNVKTCPYCNMQYVLYIEEQGFESGKSGRPVKLAKLQFDHFYDKNKYPLLSMSLYNLIPSCAVCNQSKQNKKLSLEYNPYYSCIHTKFHFEVSNPIPLLLGMPNMDQISIQLIREESTNKEDFEVFKGVFHLDALYNRHKDIAKEVFDKAYLSYYYNYEGNFNFLYNKKCPLRLVLGTYPEKENIEKRPMSKLIQDLWQQANIV